MGRMIVLANAAEGRDAEYNDWYDNTHIGEVIASGPFTAAQRFRMADAQIGDEPSHRYVAIYEYEGTADAARAALGQAAAGFTPSEASANDARIYFVEELGPRVTS